MKEQTIAYVVLLLIALNASAGEYRLLDKPNAWMVPEDIPKLCEAYLQNLQDNRDGPAICENADYPQNGGFGRPEWKSIEPGAHIGLMRQIAELRASQYFESYQYRKDVTYPEDKYQRMVERRFKSAMTSIEKGEMLLDVSYFDFDNDEKKEWVLRRHYKVDDCNGKWSFSNPMVGRYFYLAGEPGNWRIDKELSADSDTQSWNVSFYKGHTVLEVWGGDFERGRAVIELYYPHRVDYEGIDYRGVAKNHFCTFEYLR